MKKLIIIIFLLFSINLYADEFESAISAYKPTYFLFGNTQDQVHYQLSMKYNLVFPEMYGIYAGYTQRAWWALYDRSSPFTELNHEPELFWRVEDHFHYLKYFDYFQISPICHQSNGESHERNRSINTGYFKVQLSDGYLYNFGGFLKTFWFYDKAPQNDDIQKYKGFLEGEIFLIKRSKTVQYFDKEKIYFKYGGNIFTKKGWLETGLRIRLVTSRIQPLLLLQLWHGYGESLINYDKKETNLRLGITFQ